MGLFDRFKKKTDTETKNEDFNTKSNNEKEKVKKENETAANDNRRFTYMVEDVFQLKNNAGIVIVGTVHGTIKVHDAVYILHPGNQITLTEISGMEHMVDGRYQQLESATDIPVGVKLGDIKDKSQILKFSVLTSIRPQPTVDVNTAVENPYVLGLSYEYRRFCSERDYLGILVYAIAHAHYLVPVHMDKEPTQSGEGTAAFTEGSTMSFASLTHPDGNDKHVFPVFTDWRELGKWKGIFEEQNQKQPQTIIFKFKDAAAFIDKSNNSGIVINPFSQNAVFLTEEMINNIRNMEGYKKEFESKPADAVKEIKVEKDTNIMIGVPADSNEVRLIRDALDKFGSQNEKVKAIYLFLKISNENEKSYLCIVNCPKEQSRELFGEIYNEVKAYAVNVPIIDFASKDEVASLSDNLTPEACVYTEE